MMDYKYIEQLLERYWECKTTTQEEQILHAFFSQEDIPESLVQYRETQQQPPGCEGWYCDPHAIDGELNGSQSLQ